VSCTWFSPGRFSVAGDVGLQLRDAATAEWGWLWTHQTSGMGSASTELARGVEVGLVELAELLGAGPLLAQRLLYALLLGSAASGAAYAVSALTRRTGVILLCGLLGAVNPLVLISAFNPVLLLPIGLLGWATGLLLRAGRGDRPRWVAFACGTTALSYLSLNPPSLVMTLAGTVVVASLASVLVGSGGSARAWRLLARALPLALVLNLWWLVPIATALLSPAGTEVAAQTDVEVWAWSHANSSLDNVAALMAHWTWSYPEYLPAVERLDAWWWAWLRLALPTIALTAPLVTRGRARRAALSIVALIVLLVLLGKGLHPPLGEVNAWLYDHVPGLWLLREPVNKIGPLLLLLYLLAAALWLDAVAGDGRRRLRSAGTLALIGALAYPWPILTGAIVPTDRGDLLPGARVALPDAWEETAGAIEADPVVGKVLVLPLNPYYQVTTSWGYHGVDTLVAQLVHRPVLAPLPGGYFGLGNGLAGTISEVEQALRDGDPGAIPRLLDTLGVSHVVLRHDLVANASGRTHTSPDAVRQALDEVPGLNRALETEVATLYRRSVDVPPIAAYDQHVVVSTGGVAEINELLPALPLDTTVVVDGGSHLGAGSATSAIAEGARAEEIVEVDRHRDYRLTRRTSGALWAIERDGQTLRLREQVTTRLGDREVLRRPDIVVPTRAGGFVALLDPQGRPQQLINEDDADLALDQEGAIAPVASGDWRQLDVSGAVGDCARSDERDATAAGLVAEPGPEGGVRLRALAHRACVVAAVPEVRPGDGYEVSFEYRTLAGVGAATCLWQGGAEACVPTPELEAAKGWRSQTMTSIADQGTGGLELYLYGDGPDDGSETVVEYRDVRVRTHAVDREASRSIPAPPTQILRLTPDRYPLRVDQSVTGSLLGAWSDLQDCARADDRTAAESGLRAEIQDAASGPLGDPALIRLGAKHHTACVSAPVEAAKVGEEYVVTLTYRTLRGLPARLCVWQEGPNRCADLPALETGDGWHDARLRVNPESGTTALSLYLYADGADGRETSVEYRDVFVVQDPRTEVAVVPASRAGSQPPTLASQALSPARYTARIDGVVQPFTLVLREAFAPGWELRGLPDGWAAKHVMVEGGLNGWLVTPTLNGASRAELSLVHGPSIWSRAALVASSISAGGLVLVLGVIAIWRRARRARERAEQVLEERAVHT